VSNAFALCSLFFDLCSWLLALGSKSQ